MLQRIRDAFCKLCLTRRVNESIVLRTADGVIVAVVTVGDIDRGKAKIIVDAPQETLVNREEVDKGKFPADYDEKISA